MAATQHGLANGHEIGDSMVAIANKLWAFSMGAGMRVQSVEGLVLRGDCLQSMPAAVSRGHARASWTYSSFSVIQLDAPCQATLGKQAELGYDELVKLSPHC